MLKIFFLILSIIFYSQTALSIILPNNRFHTFTNLSSSLNNATYEVIYDYIIFKEATLIEEKDEERALALYTYLVNNYKSSPNYKRALKRIIEIKQKNRSEDAKKFIDLYRTDFPTDYSVSYKAALFFLEMGEKERAINLLKELFLSGDIYSIKALKRLIEQNVPISDSQRLMVITKLYDKSLYDEIIDLNKLLPLTKIEERIYLIKSLFKTRRYREVIENTKNSDSSTLKELYLLSLLRIGEREAFFREVSQLFEKEDLDFFNLYITYGEAKKLDGDYEEALKIFSRLERLFPQKLENIYWNEAIIFIRLNNFEEAEKKLKELVDNFQSDKYFFWLGKVYDYQNKDGKIFYERLKEEEGYYYLKKKKFLSKNEKNYPIKRLERVDALLSLRMEEEAREELLYSLSRGDANSEIFFIDYLKNLKLYNPLLRIGTKLKDPYLKYPPAYLDIISEKAGNYKIDPLLCLSIMREESHFRKDIVSPAKAHGLMQIIYPTAKRYDNSIIVADLFSEEKNIEIGVKYLSFLLKKFSQIEYAIAAYNAGEHNVLKWLEKDYKDIDEFIENIPFLETRNYVKKVIKSYYIYKSLYEKL